jgi:DNA primase catalytic subunit
MAKAVEKEYKYVDVYYCDENGKNSPWKRIDVETLPKFQHEEANDFNCFATVQRYANEGKVEGEEFSAPLYFDLDYGDDPAVAQREAKKVVDFFMKELDIQEQDIKVYFSGSKGFHIIIDDRALGVKPSTDLHKVYKHIAGYVKYRLGETTTAEAENGKAVEVTEPLKSVDLVVYTVKRMLRLPYSRHQKTGLYKIEITVDELSLLSLDEIKARAKVGNRPLKDGEEKTVRKRPKAGVFYADKLKEYEDAAATASQRYDKEEFVFTKDKPPVCVQDILEHGWKKDGDRNNATVQLACYFKAAGYSKDEITKTLEEWVVKHTSADSNYSVRQRIANTRSVVEAVYSNENSYKFGCAFIRSLHGEKKAGSKDYDRVPCSGELCHCVKRGVSTEEDPISLHLAATSDAELTGKLITTRVMVAGKKHTPYIVPKKIEYSCWGRDKCKKFGCPLLNLPVPTAYKDLGVDNRELIQMTATGDDNIKGILRDLSGIPSCTKYDTEIIENTNIDELLVIPMVDEDCTTEDKDSNYVLRKIYSMGNMSIDANKYYEISGYVYPHPRNQESTILVTKAKPLQDVVESFKLTDEVKESLQVLRPSDWSEEGIFTKLSSILNDLTYNVTHIVERDETLLGVLLSYHSVLRLNVPWDTSAMRGWLELKIVGDTGTGKSALIEKIMKYIGLGNRVNAESTSRTGLTYKMEQSGSGGAWYIVWGAWPLADRELIWIDEDTGIGKDEYGEMTMARSDGRLEVKRAVTAETPCRVRAILSGNVPKGKRLADYAQGAESLKDIFNNEDIRRFDFAIFMRATDVNPELYNQKLPTFPKLITSDILKNNVLFAWSRTPEQIVHDKGTTDEVLNAATELSKIYGKANDVPLVSPSDQRNKVIRLATAFAVLTHSTDETGEKVIVRPGHVKVTLTYLKSIYNAPGCGLNYYARLSVNEEELTPTKFEKLTQELRTLDTLKGAGKYGEFITLFAQQKYLRLGDVEAMLSIEKEEAKAIVNFCVRLRMLTMTSGGYRKTARFNAYIAKCFEMGLFDNLDDEI